MLTARLALIFSCFAFATPTCENQVESVTMNHEIRTMLIDIHNELRNKVAKGDQPTQNPAQNMRTLHWSEDLEKEAQDWANKCDLNHDYDTIRAKRHGQNIYQITSYYQDVNLLKYLKDGVIAWYDEVNLGYNGTFSSDTGHYSQVIWGATKQMGCGVSMTKSDHTTNTYLICNYFPGGNVMGHLPYKYGEVNCESNEMFVSQHYSHLCDINREMLLSCKNQQQR